jgi:hypothetical protein
MKRLQKWLIGAVCLWVWPVLAEVSFTVQDLQGSWKLDHTKKSLTSGDELKREDVWEFKGNKVAILHIPRDGTYYDQLPVDFSVENGQLKIAILGRSDRFDLFSVVEKNEHSMVLKGKYGDTYFFVKK